eukprot:TRINITY_DN9857_c0_g1_i1.p1 TRINITY_DN9857_c0_g1~~TRINITY_DN9857_c0_g1_i1.p1  ORF type:complete len:943 (+),score=206.15 TRINITY_DN9857_c0_g1_i1:100-2829(+)
MASRFARQLETHQAFKLSENDIQSAAERVWGDARDPVDTNVVACSADLDLFVCDRTNRVKVINMKAVREGKASDTKTLIFDPPINYRIVKIIFNTTGSLMAAVGVHQCTIVELSERVRAQLVSATDDDVLCQTHPLAEFLLSSGSRIKIEKAEWHPLSNAHLCLLTSDNFLRFYNVAVDTEEPEQILRIPDLLQHNVKILRNEIEDDAAHKKRSLTKAAIKKQLAAYMSPDVIDGDANVVTFCFGNAKSGGWLPFTVFILLDSGEIFYISPVIPYNTPMRLELLKSVEEEAHDAVVQLERSPSPVQPYEFEDVDLRKKWVYEVTGELVSVNPAEPADFEILPDPDFGLSSDSGAESDTSTKRRSSRFKNIANLAGAKHSSDWIRTRRPDSTPALRIQGPVCFVRQGKVETVKEELRLAKAMGTPTDMICTATSPPVLVRAFARGAVENFVVCDRVAPAWKHPKNADLIAHPVEAIFWEGVDLQYLAQTEPNKMNTPYTPTRLLTHPYHESLVFIYSSNGIHRMNLSWLSRLQEALKRENAPPKDFISNLKHAEIDFLLNARPVRASHPSAVVGASFLAQPSSSSMMEFFFVVYEAAEADNAEGGSIPEPSTSAKASIGTSLSPSRFEIEAGIKQDPTSMKNNGKAVPKYNANHFSWRAHCFEARRPTASKEEWLSSAVVTAAEEDSLNPRSPSKSRGGKSSEAAGAYVPPTAPGAVTRLGEALNPESPESLRYLLQWTKRVREHQGGYSNKIHHEVTTRLGTLAERVQAQSQSLQSVEDKFERVVAHKNAITDKVEQARALQEVLSKRLVLLIGLINSSQKDLSKAEMKFFKEIREQYERLGDFKSRAEDLRQQAARLVPETITDTKPFQLTEDQIVQVQGFLKTQQESISELAQAVSEVYRDAEDLSA